MKKCCNSKCPKCINVTELYKNLLQNQRKLLKDKKIDFNTYLYNIEHINKYDKP